MAAGILMIGGGGVGKITATAGTAIQYLIPGRGSMYTHLLHFSYTTSTTAHTITIQKGVDWTVPAITALSGQTKIVLKKVNLQNGTPTNIASGDLLAIQNPDSTWSLYTVSSLAADGVTVTLTTNLSQTITPNERIVSLGQATQTAHANNTYPTTASSTQEFPNSNFVGSLQRSVQQREPLLFNSNNLTVAGILNNLQWGYTRSG